MIKKSYTSYIKISLVTLMLLVATYIASPNFFKNKISFLPKNSLNFGLDLRGGSFITMQVDFNEYMVDFLDNLIDDIKDKLNNNKVTYKNIIKEKNQIIVYTTNETKTDDMKKSLNYFNKNLDIDFSQNNFITIAPKKGFIKDLRHSLLLDSIKNIRKRIDAMGISDILVQMKGSDEILIQIPISKNTEKIKKIISTTSKLTFHLTYNPASDNKKAGSTIKIKDRRGKIYEIYRKVELDGSSLKQAFATYNRKDSAVVGFIFNTIGTKKLAALTKKNVGNNLAIVIDNTLMTAPVIKEPISGGRGEITGDFDIESASELALMLRSGALPASLKVVGEKFIGPTLGEASIIAGKKSLIVTFIGISLMMVSIYRLFGFFSVIALTFNIILLVAILTMLQAVLTLPGIAGIVLTIGMAVDGNIIIFERINDELKLKKNRTRSVEDGFNNSTETIIDSNLTTLISAIVLFLIGSGPIKGFGVTLIIGVLTTLFSNIVINKILIYIWLDITNTKLKKTIR